MQLPSDMTSIANEIACRVILYKFHLIVLFERYSVVIAIGENNMRNTKGIQTNTVLVKQSDSWGEVVFQLSWESYNQYINFKFYFISQSIICSNSLI